MSAPTPTQRSLKFLRENGYTAAVVERWNHWAGVRQDLFGFADLIAFRPGEVLLVQTTTRDHMADRIRKINSTPAAHEWLKAGRIEVHGWWKKGGRWKCEVERIGP